MNFFLIFVLFYNVFLFECFLDYPAANAVGAFLNAINGNVLKRVKEKNFMENAVAGELCSRECEVNDRRVCHFEFMIKYYQAMSGACGNCFMGNVTACHNRKCVTADGVQRGILSINFQMPGPSLHVCRGDIVVVDIENEAEGVSTSMHFHGMRQIKTPFMDGVPYLTQCPIPYGEKFRYAFHADDVGTHFYHSHSGHQKIDGVYGALIVREPINQIPNQQFYDFDLPEHVILASDWMHQMADNHLPGMMRRSLLSKSLLINGRGRFLNETTEAVTSAPLTVFNVQKGMKYRFRIINAGINVCPFQFQIEKQNFNVIATELSYIEPVAADTLHFLSGERFDIVIDANLQSRDYWIRVKELAPCLKEIEGFAILRVHQNAVRKASSVEFNDLVVPLFKDEYPMKAVFNSINLHFTHTSVTETKAFEYDKSLLDTEPDQQFHLVFDSPSVANSVMFAGRNLHNFVFVTTDFNAQSSFVATINNITFQFPSFPLLSEPHRIDDSMFCDVHNMNRRNCIRNSKQTICKCVHRLKVKLNSSVEIVAINTLDKISHPLHLHGHKFHVLDSGLLEDKIDLSFEELANLNISKTNPDRPPFKDTVTLPFPGYVRFRFRASNPGFWLLHCHYDWHLTIGMALIVQVGEIHEMKPQPDDFPTCHNYLPSSWD